MVNRDPLPKLQEPEDTDMGKTIEDDLRITCQVKRNGKTRPGGDQYEPW